MTPQPFYTSKAFWVAFIALTLSILVKVHVIPANEDIVVWGMMLQAVLAGIFRWTADQPLALPGPGVTKLDR